MKLTVPIALLSIGCILDAAGMQPPVTTNCFVYGDSEGCCIQPAPTWCSDGSPSGGEWCQTTTNGNQVIMTIADACIGTVGGAGVIQTSHLCITVDWHCDSVKKRCVSDGTIFSACTDNEPGGTNCNGVKDCPNPD